MNRQTFQELASIFLKEAAVLLDAGYAHGAFYLAGYAVESAVKACIAKKTRADDFPPDPQWVREYVYTHNIQRLLKAAELDKRLDEEAPKGSALDESWATVYLWSEKSRYETKTTQQARDLYSAVADSGKGVLVWLQRYW